MVRLTVTDACASQPRDASLPAQGKLSLGRYASKKKKKKLGRGWQPGVLAKQKLARERSNSPAAAAANEQLPRRRKRKIKKSVHATLAAAKARTAERRQLADSAAELPKDIGASASSVECS